MTLNRCGYYFGITIAILTFPIFVPLAILCCSDKEAVAAHEPSRGAKGGGGDNPVVVASVSVRPIEVEDDEPTDVRE